MRRKIPSTTVALVLGCAAMTIVLAIGRGDKGVGGFSPCFRINAQGAAVFADDGTWLATLSRSEVAVLVCDGDNGHELLTLEKSGQFLSELFPVTGEADLISLSTIDRRLGPQNIELNYWKCKTGTSVRSATLDSAFQTIPGENRFLVSPGGERFYLISQLSPVQRKHMPAELQSADTLTCWELPTGKKKFVIQDDSAPHPRLSSLVFTGDRSIMAAICEQQMIVASDAVTGKELHRFTDVDAWQLAVNVDGTVLAAATQGKVRCWDLLTGKETASVNVNVPVSKNRRLFGGDTAEAVGPRIVLSSDGRHLAVCHTGRSIEMWDVAKGDRIRRDELDVKKAGAGIADVAFSPDGRLLAAVGREFTGTSFEWRNYDAHIYAWEVASGQLIHHSKFAPGRGPHRLVFRRDGQRLMVVSEQCVTLCHLAAANP